MATLSGYCENCEKPVSAWTSTEDLRREGDEGFVAVFSVSEVTCTCGTVLGESTPGSDTKEGGTTDG